MFKITSLKLFNFEGLVYEYLFTEGINYFQGGNGTGKTEFYYFIDFMFGSSMSISEKPWYKDSLKKATLTFLFDDICYQISRTEYKDINYFHYKDEDEGESILLRDYKEKLNAVFSKDESSLKNLRNFTNELLTFRTFTMFNFLGEKRQGVINDFLDKCSDIKYSLKLAPVLNYIFNNNLENIYQLKLELDSLEQQIKKIENDAVKTTFIIEEVNKNLKKLDINVRYNGKNSSKIEGLIENVREMDERKRANVDINISKLEVIYNKIDEQIKIYENTTNEMKQFERENENRKLMVSTLGEIVEGESTFNYLVNPIEKLLLELDSTISFSSYLINDKTINELKKQRRLLKNEINKNHSKFKMYSLEEKKQAFVIVEEYLTSEIIVNDEILAKKKKKIKKMKEEIKILQNSDDKEKINQLSSFITKIYLSARESSEFVDYDSQKDGFRIDYIKRGNILQPRIESDADDEIVNYYIGSMARHTLIQLSGYLGFLDILLKEDKYPIIPILVIDHISKPFESSNSEAIGIIIMKAYESIGVDSMQLFMFDHREPEELGIIPNKYERLTGEQKTGFNPFFNSSEE